LLLSLLLSLFLSLLFWFVIPSVASEPASSRSSFVSPGKLQAETKRLGFTLAHNAWGSTGKKRETAGSLATLGMTSQKSKGKNKKHLY
jgi:hypothetical protein